MNYILIVLILSAMMTSVIWIIQLIHYPAFHYISDKDWRTFHQMHMKGITPIVAPLMIIEFLFSLLWIYYDLGIFPTLNLIMLIVIWGSTFFIQVPLHQQITNNMDHMLIQKLIKTNWMRTGLWTIKSLLIAIGYTLEYYN